VLDHVLKQENGQLLTGKFALVVHFNDLLKCVFDFENIRHLLVNALHWIEIDKVAENQVRRIIGIESAL
jgi:hypothetical protein